MNIVNKAEANKALKTGSIVQYRFKAMSIWQELNAIQIPSHVSDDDYEFRILELTIEAGQTWTRKEQSINGSNDVKIMAFVDGYVMARFKGAVPFVKRKKTFLDSFKLVK